MAFGLCHVAAPRLEFRVTYPMASAAATVLVLRDGTVLTADMPALALEVRGMTGGAVGFVLWPGPRDNRTDGGPVASGTTRISSVIAGIITVGIVAEDGRRPAVCGVANVALFRGRQVPSRFDAGTTAG